MSRLKQMEPVTEQIGENTFAITPFPAFKAANLTGDLASVLGPVFSVLVPLAGGVSGNEQGGLFDIDAKAAAEALGNCSGISGDRMEALARKLLLGGHISVEYEAGEGKRKRERLDADLANELFCGDVQDMFVLCFHVIRLNFNGFFKKFATLSGPDGSGATPRPIL